MIKVKMARLVVAVVLVSTLVVSVTFWTRCGRELPSNVQITPPGVVLTSPQHQHQRHVVAERFQRTGSKNKNDLENQDMSNINCIINDDYSVPCKEDEEGEVYFPFSFIQNYFEVYGEKVEGDGSKEKSHFDWQHSYSKVYPPREDYSPTGVFMSFEHYNVEDRDRVKCISAMEGVPISTQWSASGYFYSIQIAQFGLSHYSKNLTESAPTVLTLENGNKANRGKWHVPDDSESTIQRVTDQGTQMIRFQTPEQLTSDGIQLILEKTSPRLILLDATFKFINNASITVVLRHRNNGATYKLHYVQSQTLLYSFGNNVYYGIGTRTQWSHITRNLIVDLQKGLQLQKIPKKQNKASKIRVHSIIVHGAGFIDNLTLSTTSHMSQFFDAANWLVNNQDSQGGWPIQVTRKLAGGELVLPPGWYSAMAQGQAMSMLVRAYHRTSNMKYLRAALDATKLFKVSSENHGIMTKFENKYVWYEEYPTVPSSFVLNGFIYSLIGLYDLKVICPLRKPGLLCKDAKIMYEEGMVSLKKLLPLYDSGYGSIYDLRHFTIGSSPNLARWDYHATHINQLLLLTTIDSDPIFKRTANRWIGYMKGKRAAHN